MLVKNLRSLFFEHCCEKKTMSKPEGRVRLRCAIMNLLWHILMLNLITNVHSLVHRLHFSNYRLRSNVAKFLSLTHVLSNNCSNVGKFYDAHIQSSMNSTIASSYNISMYDCTQVLDGLSASKDLCARSDSDLYCAIQHWIYRNTNDINELTNNGSSILLTNTPNYSKDMIHLTFVYNITTPSYLNSSINSNIPAIILLNYRDYLTPVANKASYKNYQETMTQLTFYFPSSEYSWGTLWYELSTDCDLFFELNIVPSTMKSYLAALLTSSDGKQVFLYFDTNILGYICLDSATYDESMNPLKLTLYYKYNDFYTYNYSSNNISTTAYIDKTVAYSNSISFSVQYGYDYSTSYRDSEFYFCESKDIIGLKFQDYKTIQLTMISKADYFTANNDLYDVSIINISDSQTLLCFVISTVLESIVLIIALAKILNLTNITDKIIFNICLTWLTFFNYFIISSYALYLRQIYRGNCNDDRDQIGQILDKNYQFMCVLCIILVNQLFELRIILFNHSHKHSHSNENEKKCNIDHHCMSGRCLENCYIELKIGEKWAKLNVDKISLDCFGCMVFGGYGVKLIKFIDEYNRCESQQYIADWVCQAQKADIFATGFVTCLAFLTFIWIHWLFMNIRMRYEVTNNSNHSKIQLLILFVIFCLCFLFGAVLFYGTKVNQVLDHTVYEIAYYTCVVISWISFTTLTIKSILVFIGCMPRSIYMLIALFVIVSSVYLDYLVKNAYDAPYAPFTIILTPIAMIAFVWSLRYD